MKVFYTFALVLSILGLALPGQAQCPTAATCTPGLATDGSASFVQAGIYSVRFGTSPAFTSSGYAEGYRDNSCTRGDSAVIGSFVDIVIVNGTSIEENVVVYLDANNDGVISASEEVFRSLSARRHTGRIAIPAGAVVNQRLRLRIASDAIAAPSLPGPCTTPAFSQTEDYFIKALPNTTPPAANFTSLDTLTCSGRVQFADASLGAPTSWAWSFGDGQTSADQNPLHFYAGSGRYTVRLIVTNANGADTLTRPNYINYNDTVPTAATCSPQTSGYCCGYGITLVKLTDLSTGRVVLNNTSVNGQAGYEDFSCRSRTNITEGRRYRINLTINPSQPQATKVWIDLNNDGIFAASELQLSVASSTNLEDTLLIPPPAAGLNNRPLRMRIISDAVNNNIAPCQAPTLGQVEDYTLRILPNTSAPVASFSVDNRSNCSATATFRSTSENAVSTYYWRFGDGMVDSTSGQVATHTYSAEGIYAVSLRVVGPYGADTSSVAAVVYTAGPIATSCASSTGQLQPQLQVGILRVELNTIDYSSSDATEGYQDFSCAANTTLNIGQPYTVTITTAFTQGTERVRLWVDINNDGTFTTNEQLFASLSGNGGVKTGTLILPTNTVVNTALRMRVLSYAGQQGGQTSACGTVNFGQAEDYSIVARLPTLPPVAAFGTITRSTCENTVAFRDSSLNLPTRWRWNFGDGVTDTTQNPTHTYTGPGTYTVSLAVTNQYGVDSITRQDFISVTELLNLAPVSCIPATQQAFGNFGVTRVSFGQINQASIGSAVSYQDFTCGSVARLRRDTTLTLSVTVGGGQQEFVKVWIDYNSDGLFTDADELVLSGSGATNPITGQVTISATAVTGRGLRMRVLSDLAQGGGTPTFDACTNPRVGQCEDYTVILRIPVPTAPTARFRARDTSSCNGYVFFTQNSLNDPTRYRWSFGDGGTDTVASPRHYYATAGTYTVTLIVSNPEGADTLVRTNYITTSAPNGIKPAACLPVYTAFSGVTGITNVTIGTASRPTANGAAGTYHDYTCDTPFRLSTTGATTFSVSMANVQEFGAMYIDYNNDSIFSQTELVAQGRRGPQGNWTGNFSVPASAQVNTLLRLRVVSTTPTGAGPPAFSPCGPYASGEAEDYAVTISPGGPIANYTFSQGICSDSVLFIYSGQGGNSFNWEFGDGTSGSGPVINHVYAASGTYRAILTVSNAVGSDSISKLVSFTLGQRPVDAVCAPASRGTLTGTGITRVQVTNNSRPGSGTILSNTADATEGYQDLACRYSILAGAGDNLFFAIRLASVPQRVQAWVDYNNDGAFTATERVYSQVSNQQNVNGFFRMGAAGVIGLLRFRIAAYTDTAQGTLDLCQGVPNGQVEDYIIHNAFTATQPEAKLAAFSLYPNPTQGKLRLSATLPSEAAPAVLTVSDVTGRTHLVQTLTPAQARAYELDLTALPKGIYLLSLSQGEARRTQRLIKN